MNGEKPTGFRYLKVDIRLVAFDELTWTERVLIADIMAFPDGQYRKTAAGIAAMLRICPRNVQRTVERLVKKGVLVAPRTGGASRLLMLSLRFRERLEAATPPFDYGDSATTAETPYGDNAVQTTATTPYHYGDSAAPTTAIAPQDYGDSATHKLHKTTLEKQQGKLQGNNRGGTDVPETPEFTPSGDAKPVKRKRSQAVKPELSEVKDFAEECGASKETAEAFFDYWESIGWKKKGGQPIVDWKAAFRNWRRREDAWHKEKPARPPRGAFDIKSYARAADERDDSEQASAEQQWANMAANAGMTTEELFKRMKERGYTK